MVVAISKACHFHYVKTLGQEHESWQLITFYLHHLLEFALSINTRTTSLMTTSLISSKIHHTC